jgi:rubrerythrin
MTSRPYSRRNALGRAGLAAAALAAAGVLRPGAAQAQTSDETLRDFLAEAIALEQIAALAYALAADDNAGTELKRLFELFRDQEQAHANALRSAIDDLGYDAPEPPDTPTDSGVFDDVDGIDDETATRLSDLLQGLDGLKGPDQRLDHLFELEQAQLSFYIAEGPDVESADLSATSAEIAGCQAQHIYVLRGEVGDNPADALIAAGEATDVSEDR